MQRGDALTADMLDEFHGFVQEELAALLEEKNAEIAYLCAIANGKFADAAQIRLHHAGLDEDKTSRFTWAVRLPVAPLRPTNRETVEPRAFAGPRMSRRHNTRTAPAILR